MLVNPIYHLLFIVIYWSLSKMLKVCLYFLLSTFPFQLCMLMIPSNFTFTEGSWRCHKIGYWWFLGKDENRQEICLEICDWLVALSPKISLVETSSLLITDLRGYYCVNDKSNLMMVRSMCNLLCILSSYQTGATSAT